MASKKKQKQELSESIKKKLFNIFCNHVGEENAISNVSLFEKVFGMHPEDVEVYKRFFMWDQLRKFIHLLRLNNELFVISNYLGYYVLSTQKECDVFVNRLEKVKSGITRMQVKAQDWINKYDDAKHYG